MNINKDFILYKVEKINEQTGQQEISYKLSITEDLDLPEIVEEDGAQLTQVLRGSLDSSADIENLINWISNSNYTPQSQEIELINRELINSLSEDDDIISKAIEEDCAIESLVATEGPLSKLKELLTNKAEGIQTSINTRRQRKSGSNLTTAYAENEKSINAALVAGTIVKPTQMTDGQLLTYYVEEMQVGNYKQLQTLYALIQENSAIQSFRKSIPIISMGDMQQEWEQMITFLSISNPDQKQEKEADSIIKAIQQKIQAGINTIKGRKLVVVGYTMREDLANLWKDSTSNDTVVEGEVLDISEENKDKINRVWTKLGKTKQIAIIEKLLPATIKEGRTYLSAYLQQQEKPLDDKVYELCIAQVGMNGKDIPGKAIQLLTSPKTDRKLKETFRTYGTEGLDLSDGSYDSASLKTGVKPFAAQLLVIVLAKGAVSYSLQKGLSKEDGDSEGGLIKNGKWKTAEEMNPEIDIILSQIENRSEERPQVTAEIVNKAAEYRQRILSSDQKEEIKSYFRQLSDEDLVTQYKLIIKSGYIK